MSVSKQRRPLWSWRVLIVRRLLLASAECHWLGLSAVFTMCKQDPGDAGLFSFSFFFSFPCIVYGHSGLTFHTSATLRSSATQAVAWLLRRGCSGAGSEKHFSRRSSTAHDRKQPFWFLKTQENCPCTCPVKRSGLIRSVFTFSQG